MSQIEFDRLNLLSEKSFMDMATLDELKEFNQLLIDFSTSENFNLLQTQV